MAIQRYYLPILKHRFSGYTAVFSRKAGFSDYAFRSVKKPDYQRHAADYAFLPRRHAAISLKYAVYTLCDSDIYSVLLLVIVNINNLFDYCFCQSQRYIFMHIRYRRDTKPILSQKAPVNVMLYTPSFVLII